MANQDKTFNAKIVGQVDIQTGDSLRVVQRLLDLEKALTAELKKTANEAVNLHDVIGRPKSEEELKKLREGVAKLAGELKVLGLVGKSAKILTVDDIKNANEMEKRVRDIARAYESIQKQKKIESGLFGMDEKDPKKAVQNLRELERAAKATQAAITMKGDQDGSLTKYKQKIEANTQALVQHIDALRSAIAVEKAHEQALKANASFDANKAKKYAKEQAQAIAENIKRDKASLDEQKRNLEDFLAWRQRARDRAHQQELAGMQKQKEMEYRLLNSGSAQTRQARTQLDFSATGRAAAGYQFQLQSDRASLLANPAFQAQDQARRQRLQDERTLAEIYRQAGARPEVSGFARSTTDQSAARKQATQEIVALQRQLVELQQRGVLTDQESLRLRSEISKKVQEESAARAKEGNRQAQQNQAERNLARVQGVGGASLMAVQASLMANYSILNGITGTIRSAVTNSVELEAAFKNVQAVTDTTATEMAGLEAKIKGVAAESKFSSIEVANAALTLGQAGLSAKEVGESIQSVAMLAAASGTSLAQAVDLVTSVVGVFDKNANDTADIANKITAAANNSKVSVDKLALGFQYAGNTAAQAGISFEETTAAMAAMSNAGIRSGSTMGTGLRQFLVEVQKPSEEFLATIRRLGLDLADLDFKAHGLVGVAKRLREAGFIASDAIKSFDVRGAAAFNAMIANPEEMQRQFDLMQDTRAGLKANEIQMSSLQAQTTRMTTAMTNLASVGFEPVSNVLKVLTGNLADAAQGLSQYKEVAQVLGILLAGTLTTAMTMHVLSLAKGAATLLGLNTAALAALRGMTLLGASSAVMTGLSAAWSGLRATVAATGAAYAITAASAGTATAVWTTATAALTGAMTRLLTVVRGLTLSSGLGIVIAGLSAAYFLLGDSAADAKAELDGLRGKADEAKGVFETQKSVIESLNNRIADLNYKQSEGKASSSDLKSMTAALNSEFGSIGLTIDSNVSSYAEMIKKLKEARGEMKEFAAAKLRLAQVDTDKEVSRRGELVEEARTGLQTNAVSTLNRAIERLKNTRPSQAQMLVGVRDEFAAGKTPSATRLANTQSIISELSESLKGTIGVGVYGDREKFAKFTDALPKFISAVSDLQESRGRKASLENERQSFEANNAYQQKKVTVGGRTMSLEQATESLGGNLRAKLKPTGDRLKDFDSFKEMADRERVTLEELEAQLREDLKDPKANTQVVMANITTVKKLLEGVKTEVSRYAGETQEEALREYNNKKRTLEAKAAMPGKENKPAAAQAIRELAVLEKRFKRRGLIDPNAIANLESSIDESTEQRVANKLYVRPTESRDRDSEMRESILKRRASAHLRAAEADKGEAALSEDLERVQQLWDSGLENLAEARKLEMEALEARQEKQKKEYKGNNRKGMEEIWSGEIEDLNLAFDSRVRQFEDSFKGFGKVATGQLLKMQFAIKRSRQGLEDMRASSDEMIYAESGRLRDMQLLADLGKRVQTPGVGNTRYDYVTKRGDKNDRDSSFTSTLFGRKGVSVTNGMGHSDGVVDGSGRSTSRGAAGTLRQRIAKEIVRIGEYELWENEKYLEALGDDDSGLIKQYREQLELAEKTYAETKERVQYLTDLAKANTILPGQREELRKLQSAAEQQGQTLKTARSEYNSARGDRKAALKENSDIQTRIAKNTEELPEELSLEALDKRITAVRDNWAEAVADMNTNKVIADGMAGILGNLTGNLGNAFAQILSGTKSVSAGFRDMATSIIKSMLDIAAQAVAMQIFKSIIGFVGGSFGGTELATQGSAGFDVPLGDLPVNVPGVASGGFITPQGKVQRAKGFAGGGSVTGGVRGRDSVPAMLMPGEFVLKQSAVNAVGTDYLHSLNQASSAVVSSSVPKAAAPAQSQPHVTNVWVVTPDQQPAGMGPNDVIAVVSDNITRGGSVKKLIKQVVTNQV